MSGGTTLPRPRLVQATLLLASMLTIMVGATISPALPAIQRAFGSGPNTAVLVGLVLTMHGLFIAVGSPLIGAFADRYGRRWLLLVSTVVYALAGGSGFVLDSLVAILVGRAVLGLAVAGVMVTVTALITDYYGGNHRDTILGRQGAFMSIGDVVLLPLAGVLADIGWRVPFLVYTVALVLLPAMAFALPEPDRREPTSDRPTSIDDLRQTLARFPLGTLALIVVLGLVGQIIFYMIPVRVPFYLEAQTGVSGSLIGAALATSTGAGGVASLLYGRVRRFMSVIGIVALTFALMFDDLSEDELQAALADTTIVVERLCELYDIDREELIEELRAHVESGSTPTDGTRTIERIDLRTAAEIRRQTRDELAERFEPGRWDKRANGLMKLAVSTFILIVIIQIMDVFVAGNLVRTTLSLPSWGLTFLLFGSAVGWILINTAQSLKYNILPFLIELVKNPKAAIRGAFTKLVENPRETVRESWKEL